MKPLSDTTIGIKEHKEMEMKSAMCGDRKYLGGMDPAEYSLKQENALAENIRKHHAK